jgi:hypothetical protein
MDGESCRQVTAPDPQAGASSSGLPGRYAGALASVALVSESVGYCGHVLFLSDVWLQAGCKHWTRQGGACVGWSVLGRFYCTATWSHC